MKVHSSTNCALIECVDRFRNIYRVRYDIRDDMKDGEKVGFAYEETEFNHKPSMQEIKEVVIDYFNKIIDRQIIESFTWNGMKVWLTTENQFNYKVAYDLAVQTSGKSLPVTYKFGEADDPVYYTFATVEQLSDFYLTAVDHVNRCLSDGWKTKDSIDFTKYDIL